MDSTLLDQIRHLCRDRAAYEKLKAILVQQERVHQMGWEDRHDNILSQQESSSSASDIFKNIIAREKGLAQLADAIQRSPSLELVLQVAVQVTQKLLQVDRVAIFRRHSDGRSEFITDAIATGIKSLAEMPERQLLLSQHMLESTDSDQFTQTIEGLRTSNLSHHLSTLLEQINISSYAANKIYAGHDCWGVLVAFHGSVYHVWSESDRTSLSLVAAQIGIAISLTDLRSQSHILTHDLQNLQTELENLQQVVTELAHQKSETAIAPPATPIDCDPAPEVSQDIHQEEDTGEALVNVVPLISSASQDEEDVTVIQYQEIQDEEDITVIQYQEDEQIDAQADYLEDIPRDIDSENSALIEMEVVDHSISDDIDDLSSAEALANPELETEIISNSQNRTIETSQEDDTTPQLDELDVDQVEPDLAEPEIVDRLDMADPVSISPPTVPSLELSELSTLGNSEITGITEEEIDEDDREPAIEPHFMETILAVAGNDSQGIQFLVDVIDNYLEETPRLVQAIDKAIAVNDQSRLLHILNRLRISSDYVGALPLAYQCRQLESAVKANYVVLMYASLSQVAIESQRATNAIRIERVRYAMIMDSYNRSGQ